MTQGWMDGWMVRVVMAFQHADSSYIIFNDTKSIQILTK